MKKGKCVVCLKVKGKRGCQLNDSALICPRCCAQIRNSNCKGCGYYAHSEQYAIEKTTKGNPRQLTKKHFVMRIYPGVEEKTDKALTIVENGDIKAGEEIISELFEKYPDSHTVQYAKGVVCAMKEQYKESLTYFDKAIEIFPYFVEAWFNKGTSHQKLLDIDEAIKAFKKVVELGNPTEKFVRYANDFITDLEKHLDNELGIPLDNYLKSKERFEEAFTAMRKGQWDKALIGFKAVVAMNPKHPQSYGNMGTCYIQLGYKQEALAAFDKALELNPNYEPAIINRAIAASLEEGEKISSTQLQTLDYYKQRIQQEKEQQEEQKKQEQPVKKKSLFRRILEFFKKK
ncbi:tetratricopeptide repeat protein [Candidatus Parabeggiatoa sp. HSG14]|uniref:tetratricopeptide repeat protein n=1 Tax=Candidatus Parabeggiatoa sp. HSG14 TaxID=3055593 RepID=UPI0025A75CEA|nr:tetratricopeptide repeat protein [Thiotrichales bacterium HSG14]